MRPAWLGCEMTCSYRTSGTTIIYSVHEHVFELPWLCDVNQGNSYSSLAILDIVHWLYSDLYICSLKLKVPVAINTSVYREGQN